MKNSLIPIDHVNSLELFTQGGLNDLLQKIAEDVKSFVPDLESVKGRKEIAATARKVASSKVVIDKAGKELVSEWKAQAKEVDVSRKHAREFLDDLRDEIRQPLSDYEEKAKQAAIDKMRTEELLADEVAAYAENEIFDREQALKEKEAFIAELQALQERKAEAKREEEAERKRLEQLRLDAESKAKREAEEAIQAEKDRAKQAERDKVEAEQRLERAAEEAKERERLRAEQVERDKVEAEERSELDKQDAIERERRRAEKKEIAEKRESEARKADIENRKTVNNRIVNAFKTEDIDETTAKVIVRAVAQGAIPHMIITY
jgi:hypothetical protein